MKVSTKHQQSPTPASTAPRRANLLVRAFRALMPHDEQFIERFCEHSRLIVPAAEAFRALMSGDGQAASHAAEINRLEEEADQVTRATVLAIHKTFVTPFDRSQILDLITALDDTVDLMKDTGRRMIRYGVGFTPEMQGMACGAPSAARQRPGRRRQRGDGRTSWQRLRVAGPHSAGSVRTVMARGRATRSCSGRVMRSQ